MKNSAQHWTILIAGSGLMLGCHHMGKTGTASRCDQACVTEGATYYESAPEYHHPAQQPVQSPATAPQLLPPAEPPRQVPPADGFLPPVKGPLNPDSPAPAPGTPMPSPPAQPSTIPTI